MEKFLKNRDFQSALEIVESDIRKAEIAEFERLEDVPEDYTLGLAEMRFELQTYMSYLEVPDNSDDYY